MQRRRLEKTWNQSRPVFFLCDEYQEIVSCAKDGVSDLNFWDKSRSSGCIGVISPMADRPGICISCTRLFLEPKPSQNGTLLG
jgi:hypothetical protein